MVRPVPPNLDDFVTVRKVVGRELSPASKRGQDKHYFCRSAAIYHNYDILMA